MRNYLVAKRVTHVQMKDRTQIIKIETFRSCVEEVHATGNKTELTVFLEVWRRGKRSARGQSTQQTLADLVVAMWAYVGCLR